MTALGVFLVVGIFLYGCHWYGKHKAKNDYEEWGLIQESYEKVLVALERAADNALYQVDPEYAMSLGIEEPKKSWPLSQAVNSTDYMQMMMNDISQQMQLGNALQQAPNNLFNCYYQQGLQQQFQSKPVTNINLTNMFGTGGILGFYK